MFCYLKLLGTKLGYNYSGGLPHIRITNAKRFAEVKGFNVVVDTLKGIDFQTNYPGSDVLLQILRIQTVIDVSI